MSKLIYTSETAESGITISSVDKIATAVNTALGIFASAETLLEGLQPVLIDLLTALQGLPTKKDVRENPDLIKLFERTYRGIDRSKLIEWFAQFSPVRVRIDLATGRFDKIGWKDGAKWDVEGAKTCDWWTAQGAANTKAVKTGEYSAARKSLAKVIARKLYAETGGTEIADLKATIDKIKDGFFEGVLSDALDTIRSDKWDEWTDGWDARQEKEAQAEREKEAKKAADKAAKKAEIDAAMAALKAAEIEAAKKAETKAAMVAKIKADGEALAASIAKPAKANRKPASAGSNATH